MEIKSRLQQYDVRLWMSVLLIILIIGAFVAPFVLTSGIVLPNQRVLTIPIYTPREVASNVSLDRQVGSNGADALQVWLTDTWSYDASAGQAGVGWYSSTNNRTHAGQIFTNIAIPQGATITTAYLSFCSYYNSTSSNCNSTITAYDADTCNPSWTDVNDFNTRRTSNTTAIVAWDNIASWTAGTWYDSPSIITVIQEVVDRAGLQ